MSRTHASLSLSMILCLAIACEPTDPSQNKGTTTPADMPVGMMMDMPGPTPDMPTPTPDMPAPVDMGDDMPAPVDMDMGGGGVDMPPADMKPDMPVIPSGDYPKPAVITSAGAKDTILLLGTILTPSGVIEAGEVLVIGDTIACAEESCSGRPDAAGATIIQTHGFISPGLIDAHNHLAYNFLREWVPEGGKKYTNRYQWADEPSYEDHVRPYANNRSSNSHFCPGSRWGELRSMLHGTTTMQGQSFARTCTRGGVRNADQHHELDYHDHMRTSIGSVRDINDDAAQGYLDGFSADTEPDTRFAVHMAEGYSGDNIELEFASFAGRDTRNNRHMGSSLLADGTAVLIHSVGVTDDELQEAKATGSFMVWSPSSNIVLYERTSDINRILELGIITGLGPDWTLSGEDDMLGELRYARQWAIDNAAMRVTPLKLWEMSTKDGAEVVGLANFIGELVPGQLADITVFRRRNPTQDAHEQVISSRVEDVRMVMIGGEVWTADQNLSSLARRDDCDTIDACGVEKFVCVRYTNDDDYDSIATIEGDLIDIMEGTGFPADEQYGRGDEVLPLFSCE